MRSVPLARRNLLADRRRLAASVVGVGLAVMLILLLEGMWAGIRSQSRAYSERSGADLFVLQPGVRDLTPGVGTVSLAALDTVREVQVRRDRRAPGFLSFPFFNIFWEICHA